MARLREAPLMYVRRNGSKNSGDQLIQAQICPPRSLHSPKIACLHPCRFLLKTYAAEFNDNRSGATPPSTVYMHTRTDAGKNPVPLYLD